MQAIAEITYTKQTAPARVSTRQENIRKICTALDTLLILAQNGDSDAAEQFDLLWASLVEEGEKVGRYLFSD